MTNTTAPRHSDAVAAGIVALLLLLAGFALFGALALDPTTAPAASTMVAEDDARWDCATMGNRVCGDAGDVVLQDDFDRIAQLRTDAPEAFLTEYAPAGVDVSRYGGTAGGAVCDTDAHCALYELEIGLQ